MEISDKTWELIVDEIKQMSDQQEDEMATLEDLIMEIRERLARIDEILELFAELTKQEGPEPASSHPAQQSPLPARGQGR